MNRLRSYVKSRKPANISRDRWLCWQRRVIEGKAKKVPTDIEGKEINGLDPANHMALDRALQQLTENTRFAGLGFVVGHGVGCVDVDHCIDKQGRIAPKAQMILDRFPDAQWEVSPSGTGLHIWLRVAGLPAVNKRRTWDGTHSLEIANKGKFFTVVRPEIMDALWALPASQHTDAARILLDDYFAPRQVVPLVGNAPVSVTEALADAQAIERIEGHATLARLWAGDWSGYGNQSRADYVLIGALAGLVSWDYQRTQRLFLASGLGKRRKAHRRDYFPRTFDALQRDGFVFNWRDVRGVLTEEDAAHITAFGAWLDSDGLATDMGCRPDALATLRCAGQVLADAWRKAGTVAGVGVAHSTFMAQMGVSSLTVRRAISLLAASGWVTVTQVNEHDAQGIQLPTNRFTLTPVAKYTPYTGGSGSGSDTLPLPMPYMAHDCFARGKSFSSKASAKQSLGKIAAFVLHKLDTGAATIAQLAAYTGACKRTMRRLIARLHVLGIVEWSNDTVTTVKGWHKALDGIAMTLTTFRIGRERQLQRTADSIRYALNIIGFIARDKREGFKKRLINLQARADRLKLELGFAVAFANAA